MAPFTDVKFANPHSSDHAMGWESGGAIEKAAGDIAAVLGADGDEIVFTSGATEANNLALLGLYQSGQASGRNTIVAATSDHKSVLAVGRALERRNMRFQCVGVDSTGRIELDHLRQELATPVVMVSLSVVNSEIGTIQNVKKIAEITHQSGALLHCDAAQAPCALDFSSLAEIADLISLSGHKIYGPKGIGALYIRRSLQAQIEPLIYGGGQQRNLRSGTVPTALCVGFATALRMLAGERGAVERGRIASLRDNFIRQLKETGCPFVVNGALGEERHPGNANLQFVGFSAHDLLGLLQPNLAASIGSACSTGIPEPSHVLRAIGLDATSADSSVRFSVGRYTTQQDIDAAVRLIADAIAKMSNAGLRDAG